MTHARFVVPAVALGASLAVALCCTSAQTQEQTASPEATIWDHNGSVMYLVAKGSSREFYYQKPRPGMLDAGARPGSLLFRGQFSDGQYSGTAYIFNAHCGPIAFEVKGPRLDTDERIMLTGEAPRVGRDCRTYGSYTSNLEFRRLKTKETAQSQELLPQPPGIGGSKPEVTARTDGELPSTPPAQLSAKTETPVAAKEASAGVTEPNVPSTPITQAPVAQTSGAKDLDKYKWGAAFIVMIVWLSIVLFGKVLLRRKG